jgi:hypothetical protein
MQRDGGSLCLFSGTPIDSAPVGNWGDAVDFDFPPRQNLRCGCCLKFLNKQRDAFSREDGIR